MVRGIHTRKRSGGPIRSSNGKRRRISRRRPFKSRRSTTLTSKSGFGNNLTFRSRKISRRRWNKMLWDSTLQKAHYRSIASATGTFASANSSGLIRWYSSAAIGNDFFTTGGGAQVLDSGVTVPLFKDDIVLRGGKVGIRFANQAADTMPMQVFCYLIRTVNLSVVSTRFPAGGADLVVGADPTVTPDFTKVVGRVLASKSFLLENSSVGMFETRIKIAKIDQEAIAQDSGSWYWIFGIGNAETATQPSVTKTNWWNLSFAADAIGTT